MGRHKVIVVDEGRGKGLPGGLSLTYPAAHDEARSDAVRAVHCLWLEDVPAASTLPGRAWLVEERPQWDRRQVPGVTRFSFLRRAAGLSHDEFARHWTEVHAPLARVHHPALLRYVQNIVLEPLGDAEELDGIVELGFATREDLELRMYDSDAGREVIAADVRSFIDVADGWRVVTVDRK